LFLVYEEKHIGEGTRFMGLFSRVYVRWSSRAILSSLAVFFLQVF